MLGLPKSAKFSLKSLQNYLALVSRTLCWHWMKIVDVLDRFCHSQQINEQLIDHTNMICASADNPSLNERQKSIESHHQPQKDNNWWKFIEIKPSPTTKTPTQRKPAIRLSYQSALLYNGTALRCERSLRKKVTQALRNYKRSEGP